MRTNDTYRDHPQPPSIHKDRKMKLSELNDLLVRSRKAQRQAADAEKRRHDLARIRDHVAKAPLMPWLKGPGVWSSELSSLIEGVINEHSAALLLVLEARQSALAQQSAAEHALLNAQLAALVDPEEAS